MRPGYIALVFWVVAAFAVFGIVRSLRTGHATSPFTYWRDQEPGLFWMTILVRISLVGLAIAETGYALGLTGDPIAALQSIMPFLIRAHTS
jgi:hypothetical protein